MTVERKKRRGPIGVLRENRRLSLVVLVVLAVTLYPLSAGPGLWAWAHGLVSGETLTAIYAPVDFVFDRAPTPIVTLFDEYKSLWLPAQFLPMEEAPAAATSAPATLP